MRTGLLRRCSGVRLHLLARGESHRAPGPLPHLTLAAAKSCAQIEGPPHQGKCQEALAPHARPDPPHSNFHTTPHVKFSPPTNQYFILRTRRHLTPTLKSVNCDFAHGDYAQPARRGSAGLPVPAARSRVFLWPFPSWPLRRRTAPRHSRPRRRARQVGSRIRATTRASFCSGTRRPIPPARPSHFRKSALPRFHHATPAIASAP